MGVIVSFGRDRPRPRRSSDAPPSEAQILLFTGVRYCRDEDELADVPEPHVIGDRPTLTADSSLALDLAAH